MAYIIRKLDVSGGLLAGDMLDSGQTRWQVENALVRLGVFDYSEKQKFRLPRFGRGIYIINPLTRLSVVIEHK